MRRRGSVDLCAGGKTWARLLEGLVLEVKRGELTVRFDLRETSRLGRVVVVGGKEEGNDFKRTELEALS